MSPYALHPAHRYDEHGPPCRFRPLHAAASRFEYVESAAISGDGKVAVAFGRLRGGGEGMQRFAVVWHDREEDRSRILSTGSLGSWGACATVSPCGRMVACGTGRLGMDQLILLQSAREVARRRILHLQYHDHALHLGFSRFGEHLAAGTLNGTVRVVDTDSGRPLLTVGPTMDRSRGHVKRVHAVALPEPVEWVLSGSRDGTAAIWRMGDGRELLRFEVDWSVQAVALARRGTLALLAAGRGDAVHLGEIASGRILEVLSFPGFPDRLAVSHGDRWVAAGGNGVVVVWELESGREVGRVSLDSSRCSNRAVRVLAFLPDDRLVAGFGNGDSCLLGPEPDPCPGRRREKA